MIEFYNPFSRKYLILTQTPQTYAEFASRFALAAPDGTREFTMRVLRKSAEFA